MSGATEPSTAAPLPTQPPPSTEPPALGATAPVANDHDLDPEPDETEHSFAPPAIAEPAPTPEAERRVSPSVTAVDGSLHRPKVRRPESPAETPAWSTPPWLSDRTGSPPAPSAASMRASSSEPSSDDDSMFGEHARASIESVALRMQRIKASAAAVRDAIASETLPVERARAERPVAQPLEADLPVAPRHAPTSRAPRHAPERELTPVDVEPELDSFVEPSRNPSSRGRASGPTLSAASGSFDTPHDAVEELDDDGFFGDDDLGDDDFDDDFDSMTDGELSGFGEAVAARPLPWRPIGIGAGLVLVVGLVAMSGLLSDKDDDAQPTADEAGEVAEQDPAPTEPSPPPGAGKPVEPAPSEQIADATPEPATPPAELDAAVREQLEQARGLYDGASGGSRRKKLEEARGLLDQILAKHPTHGEALLLMAQVLLEQGDAENSLNTATKCTTVAPQQADCWLTLGVLAQDRNQKDSAVAAYEKYLALAPDGRYAGEVQKQLNRLR